MEKLYEGWNEDEDEDEYEYEEIDSEAEEVKEDFGVTPENDMEGSEDIPVKGVQEGKEDQGDAFEECLGPQQKDTDRLSDIINRQLLEIADGHKKNTQLYQDIAELESRISDYEKKQRELEERNGVLLDRHKKLEEELAQIRGLTQSLQERERALQANVQLEIERREECERRLYQLEHSKSWKLTEPLRKILGMINKK